MNQAITVEIALPAPRPQRSGQTRPAKRPHPFVAAGGAGALKLVLALTLLLGLVACKQEQPVYNARFLAFGTLVDISLIRISRADAERVVAAIEQDFTAMDRAWHAWRPGPLGRVNRLLPSGDWFAAPPSVLPLVKLGQRYARQSDDLFDPAIGRLIALWGFHKDHPECRPPPPKEEIERLVRAHPRMSDIDVKGIMMRSRNPAVQLDFGAFAKGYGIDRAIDHLREMGVRNAIVNAGGDLRAIGSREGRPWRIAIRAPSGGSTLGFVEVSGDESVFTSGDYERNFIYRGQTYHHIIDPRTGYPARGFHSVTVIHTDGATADAAATALFVAGPKRWVEIARRMGVHEVLAVDYAGTLHMTPAMAKRVRLLEHNPDISLSEPL